MAEVTESATPAPKKPATKKPAAAAKAATAEAAPAAKAEPVMITVRAIQRGYTDRIIEPGEVFQHPESRFSEVWMERVELDTDLSDASEE